MAAALMAVITVAKALIGFVPFGEFGCTSVCVDVCVCVTCLGEIITVAQCFHGHI